MNMPSDSVVAAIIALLGTLGAGWIAWRAQYALRRNDALTAGLSTQITGWNSLSSQLRELADDLVERLQRSNEDCEKRIVSLRDEMRQRDADCTERISRLEAKLRERLG